MEAEFLNLTSENIDKEHLCCIIRSKKPHIGVEAKRQWLKERLNDGHVFRKLNVRDIVFIEYAPLEKAWVPIIGNNYYYVYCFWISGKYKGKGYGKALMNYCIADAKRNGKSGICMLGAKKQKAWLSDQSFAKKYGFKVVDTSANDYELLALSFDGSTPCFTNNARDNKIKNNNLTIYYDFQCPYIYQTVEIIQQYCNENNIDLTLNKVTSLEQAKKLPCVFNNWGIFFNGKFQTVNLLDISHIKKILEK